MRMVTALSLMMGIPAPVRRCSVCCKWFRWAVLPHAGTLEAEIYRGRDLKRCAVCGGVFVQNPTGEILPRLRRQSSQAAENRK